MKKKKSWFIWKDDLRSKPAAGDPHYVEIQGGNRDKYDLKRWQEVVFVPKKAISRRGRKP